MGAKPPAKPWGFLRPRKRARKSPWLANDPLRNFVIGLTILMMAAYHYDFETKIFASQSTKDLKNKSAHCVISDLIKLKRQILQRLQ
jgi:hypothetical protein